MGKQMLKNYRIYVRRLYRVSDNSRDTAQRYIIHTKLNIKVL